MQFLARLAVLAALALAAPAHAEVDNLRVVTDASPDYHDVDGLIRSATSRWQTPEEKLWALFYWNHVARRQTRPMILHGTALTDPIRQFNDYGYTMCSTISGINCSLWDAMGFRTKYWDISNHTVSEVEYGGRWHMVDNSMSALYTLCDGKTLAGVADIGATRGCPASGGREEPGHIARYHSLTATSKNGFLTGADTLRSLDEEYRCFNPNGLKYRPYFYDWDRGHRYILNLREGEVYTRHYRPLGATAAYYVPNGGKDPDDPRFHLRGNGERTWKPALTPEGLAKVAQRVVNVRALPEGGIVPARAGAPAEVVFKVEGANVITSVGLRAEVVGDVVVAVSTTNGLQWQEVWKGQPASTALVGRSLVEEVNGAYEVLVKVSLREPGARLNRIEFDTLTMLNSKTQPQLNLGKNTVHVSAGDPAGSIVCWPDLRDGKAQPYVVEQRNVTFEQENNGFQGTLHATRPNEEAYVVFRMDAPGDVTRVQYGGRLYNRAPEAHVDFLHSFDGGKTWTKSYSLTDTKQPWDVIHYETVKNVPAGTRSVLLKYLLNASAAGRDACSLYAVRVETNYRPADSTFRPVKITFNWSERQADNTLVERSHTQVVTRLPARYTVNVGGVDHPVVNSLRVNLQGVVPDVKPGYSDGQDVGGEKFVPRWATYGRNLAEGKPYALSLPSETNWEAGDPDGKKLTDGIVGPSFAGGTSYRTGAIWSPNKNPRVTLDLGSPQRCASFGLNVHGYPWWDALQGEIKDAVEVWTSADGKQYTRLGNLQMNLRRKDIPVNFILPDSEELTGATLRLAPPAPVETRFVEFRVANRRHFCVTEIEVLDSLELKPFDLRIALPDDGGRR